MNQHNGQLELSLELSQEGEQRGDLSGVVFVHPVQPYERVQNQQHGVLLLDGMSQALPVGGQVQTERGSGDDLNRQRGKRDLGGSGDAFQALAHDRQRVFRREEQHRSTAPHGELPQTSGARSDADGHVQGQEAFAAFRFATQDADGLVGPELLDQPLGLGAVTLQLTGALNRQRVHAFLMGLGSSEKTSK